MVVAFVDFHARVKGRDLLVKLEIRQAGFPLLLLLEGAELVFELVQLIAQV